MFTHLISRAFKVIQIMKSMRLGAKIIPQKKKIDSNQEYRILYRICILGSSRFKKIIQMIRFYLLVISCIDSLHLVRQSERSTSPVLQMALDALAENLRAACINCPFLPLFEQLNLTASFLQGIVARSAVQSQWGERDTHL